MKPGDQIGPFVVEKELGSGAMGVVYRGLLPANQLRVAIKIMLPGFAATKSAADRFRREVEILKQLQHPHIVRLLKEGEHEGQRYYAMEYIQGESMDRVLARRGRFSWEEVVTFGRQLCDALQHAHDKGVIHRDLKPANLMLLKDGGLKLTDFGIAKDLDVTALTEANCTVGTASYMSPEQCKGERNLTHKSDLYSLGIVFFELLTGKKPFVAENVMDMFMLHVKGRHERPAHAVDMPKWLDVLVCQLLEKKPEQRPRDARAVAEALDQVLEKVEARQSAGAEAVQKTGPRKRLDDTDRTAADALAGKKKRKKKVEKLPWHRRTWVKAAGLLLALGLVVFAGWLFFVGPPEDPEELYRRVEVLATSQDPADRELAVQARGPIETYLKKFRKRDESRTRQVEAWRDDIRLAQAEEELAKTVKAARRISEDKMDALTPVERAALKAAQAEEAGDLPGAREKWDALLQEFTDGGPYALIARQRLDVAYPSVRDREKHLNTLSTGGALLTGREPEISDAAERAAFTAYRHELVGDLPGARARWQALKGDLQGKADARVWYLMAADHARDLKERAGEDGAKSRAEAVRKYLKGGEELHKNSELKKARVVCLNILALYEKAETAAFEPVVAEAKALLEQIGRELKES